jgi:hypothetical protein
MARTMLHLAGAVQRAQTSFGSSRVEVETEQLAAAADPVRLDHFGDKTNLSRTRP